MIGLDLQKRSDIHWARKIWHMGGVAVIFLLFQIVSPFWAKFLISLALIIFVPADLIRQRSKALNDWVLLAFKPIMRHGEQKRIAGTTYLLSGAAICIFFFPHHTTSIVLLFLAFADPLASYVGIRWGKDKIFGHKSIQGFMAAFVVCAVSCFLYLMVFTNNWDRALAFSLLAGLIGAFAELVPIAKLDDNFTLPVLSAFGLQILFYFFDFFN